MDYIQLEKNNHSSLSEQLNILCKQKGIKHIDLLQELKDYPSKQDLFLPCDAHWSAKGNKLVADVIREKLYHWNYLE